MKKAIYPGSFDPFTYGHLDIVKKASKLFDEVHILIACNPNKTRCFDAFGMGEAIENCIRDERINNCRVVVTSGLVARYALENNIGYIVRGIRGGVDYFYEESIAEANKLINPDIECVYLRAENIGISSSVVREINKHQGNITRLVPPAIVQRIVFDNFIERETSTAKTKEEIGNIEFNIQMLERLKRAIKNNKKLKAMPELFEEENEKEHPERVGSVFAGVLNQSIMYLRELVGDKDEHM